MKVVGLVRVEAVSPIVTISKKGKGRFYETAHHIQSSTILGALAREIILDNYSRGFGNCAKLDGPNRKPDCKTCGSVEDCAYTSVWVKKELKLSYCLPCEQKSLSDTPPIINLRSLFGSKEGELYADGLMQMALYHLASQGKVTEEFLLKEMKIRDKPCKRKEGSVYLHDNSIELLRVRLNDSPHVAIDTVFKSSERGYVFNYTTIPRGTRFTATVMGEEELVMNLFSGHRKISVGLGKSRGYGSVEINIIDKTVPRESFVDNRAKDIRMGFEKIKESTDKFLEGSKKDSYLGTVTGLSPLVLEDGNRPPDAIAKRINLLNNQIIHGSACKCGVHIRYEFSGRRDGKPVFILSPVVEPGYAAVFAVNGDLDTVSRDLAEREVSLESYQPWFGWVTINHPIHYSSSTLS